MADSEETRALSRLAGPWWVFLVTGIAWLLIALIVLQFDYSTVVAIGILAGIVILTAGLNEFILAGLVRRWRWAHVLLGVIFVAGGVFALFQPEDAFATLVALVGFFLLLKGILDIVVSLSERDAYDLWWAQLIAGIIEILLAFWVAGYPGRSMVLLVIWVAAAALVRGITEIVVGFKLHRLQNPRAA